MCWDVATLVPHIAIAKVISKKNNDIWRRRTSTTYKTAQYKSKRETAVLVHGVLSEGTK
jgi:hypothetical protein